MRFIFYGLPDFPFIDPPWSRGADVWCIKKYMCCERRFIWSLFPVKFDRLTVEIVTKCQFWVHNSAFPYCELLYVVVGVWCHIIIIIIIIIFIISFLDITHSSFILCCTICLHTTPHPPVLASLCLILALVKAMLLICGSGLSVFLFHESQGREKKRTDP